MEKKKNSKAIDIADLPVAKSRVEEYLDFLCGRATVLADLPKPQSRVEHFLEYLCYNGGLGGGQQPLNPKTIIKAELVDDTLKFTHLDTNVTEIQLDYIKEWIDLEHVYEITKQNIFNPSDHVIKGSYYYNHNNGSVTTDNSGKWGRTVIPFTHGTIYTVYKTKHVSQTFVYLNEDGDVIDVKPMSGTVMNGNTFTRRYKIDTNNSPQDAVAFGFNIVVDKNNKDYIDVNRNVMVFAEDLTQGFDNLIPKTDGAEIVIDGSQVSIGFDATGTNILANTVNDAIKFLDKRVANAGGGTVTSVNGETPVGGNVILTSQVTQTIGQNIVLRVGNQDFATLECMTDAQADGIINGWN